jgi:transposase
VRTSEARDPDGVVEEVVLGVDTHLDVHVAVVLDGFGRHLGELAVPTTGQGAMRNSSVGRRVSAT